jgi:hypothetical protein
VVKKQKPIVSASTSLKESLKLDLSKPETNGKQWKKFKPVGTRKPVIEAKIDLELETFKTSEALLEQI